MSSSNWEQFFVVAFLAAFSPWIAKKIGQFWDAVERYDLRRDEKARLKKEARAARKAAKKAAKLDPYYTSAAVVPPRLLTHDRSGDSGSSNGAPGPHEPG